MSTGYRKLGRTSSQRKAILRSQVTALINNGKIVTTYARAKETSKLAEKLIALAVKEKDNYDKVTVKSLSVKRDENGKKVREEIDGKKRDVIEVVEKEVNKDKPSRLNAKRKMLSILYPVTEVPQENKGKRKNTKKVNLVDKLFTDIAPRYKGRNGGYTRIVKIGQRRGDGALEVLLELV